MDSCGSRIVTEYQKHYTDGKSNEKSDVSRGPSTEPCGTPVVLCVNEVILSMISGRFLQSGCQRRSCNSWFTECGRGHYMVTRVSAPDNFNKPALHLARDVYVSLSLAAERVFKNVNKIKS